MIEILKTLTMIVMQNTIVQHSTLVKKNKMNFGIWMNLLDLTLKSLNNNRKEK